MFTYADTHDFDILAPESENICRKEEEICTLTVWLMTSLNVILSAGEFNLQVTVYCVMP